MVVKSRSGGMGGRICMEWHVKKAVHHSSTSAAEVQRNRLERLSMITSAR